MSIFLKDDDGQELEIDGEMLMKLLHHTYQIGVGNGVMHLHPPMNNTQALRKINFVLKKTWGNSQWLKNFVHHGIYGFVRRGGVD